MRSTDLERALAGLLKELNAPAARGHEGRLFSQAFPRDDGWVPSSHSMVRYLAVEGSPHPKVVGIHKHRGIWEGYHVG